MVLSGIEYQNFSLRVWVPIANIDAVLCHQGIRQKQSNLNTVIVLEILLCSHSISCRNASYQIKPEKVKARHYRSEVWFEMEEKEPWWLDERQLSTISCLSPTSAGDTRSCSEKWNPIWTTFNYFLGLNGRKYDHLHLKTQFIDNMSTFSGRTWTWKGFGASRLPN